jgi:hypothetical protein
VISDNKECRQSPQILNLINLFHILAVA